MRIDDWTVVTKRDFDEFRRSRDGLALTEKSDAFTISTPTPVIAPTPSTPAPKQRDLLSEFKKGIKWDASLFVVLKDLKQWDSWHRSTVAQARAQDVYDVLDPAYKPTPIDKDLFDAKQRYMYAVFERVLQMDKGKALVRSNEATSDARLIFTELCEDALRSTRASIDSSRLLSYITSVRIGDGMWNGTSHSFILHWQEQVRLYESLVDTASHFSSDQKMHMLQNAVHPEEELRQVKNQADQLQAFHGKSIGYDPYCKLLLSAASNLDAKHAPKGRARPAKRSVYAHDLGDYEDDEFHDAYNLDCDITELQANVHNQQSKDHRFPQRGTSRNMRNSPTFAKGNPTKPRLTIQQWHSLEPEARATWDLLSDEAKAIILGLRKDPGKRAVNLHNISAYDFMQANFHESLTEDNDNSVEAGPDTTEDLADTEPQLDEDTSTALLAYLSKQKSTTHPGHLANVLSTTKSKNAKGARFMPKSDTDSSKGDEITINGKKYRQVQSHRIYYSVSSHKSRRIGSLVDRGANGGIAGDDVRIIEKSD